MVTYKKVEYIKDREVFEYEITLGNKSLLVGEVDTNEESLEEHRLWLEDLCSAIREGKNYKEE